LFKGARIVYAALEFLSKEDGVTGNNQGRRRRDWYEDSVHHMKHYTHPKMLPWVGSCTRVHGRSG